MYRNDMIYRINADKTVTVTDNTWSGTVLDLRCGVGGREISAIGEDAFADCVCMEELRLPESLRSIGSFAFGRCESLREVRIPEGVETIGDHAFAECYSLSRVGLPTTLTQIGEDVFDMCPEDLVIAAEEGSYAYSWALEQGFACIAGSDA